jgi:LysM repeat protein
MQGRHGSSRRRPSERRWKPPLADGGWPLRLRFGCIAIAFACCTWFGLRAVSGRVSFVWFESIQQQSQALLTSAGRPARVAAVPTAGGSRSPLVQSPLHSDAQNAQPVPAVTAPSAPSASSVAVLVPTATAIATATATRAPTGRPAPTETAAGKAAAAPATAATVAADLAAGPHTVYVVRAGDTLYGIARRYGLSASVLADFNHLAPPYKIIQGHRLLIPAV